MTTTKNRLRIDLEDNADLKAALGGLPAGDKCRVTFDLLIVSNDENGFEGNIEEIEYETSDAESDEEKSGEVEPTTEDPVMAVISARNKKDAKKSKPIDDEDADVASD